MSVQVETSLDADELNILLSIPTGTDPKEVIQIVGKVLEKYVKNVKSCPHCNIVGSISEVFGWRNCSGKIYAQSWCRKCRAGK